MSTTMDKRVKKNIKSDRLILVNAKKLFDYIDKSDLSCRESENIQDLYHRDWFFEKNGEGYFTPPTVFIDYGVIKFINGRHRVILLSRHLDAFPLLIGNLDHVCGKTTERSLSVLQEITMRKLEEHSIFNNLPDLEYGNFPSEWPARATGTDDKQPAALCEDSGSEGGQGCAFGIHIHETLHPDHS